MIELTDIQKSYKMGANSLQVLKGINLSIKEGEFVAIMGSSGSGKSTLLNIIGMLDTHDTGIYQLGDVIIEKLNESKAATYRNQFLGFIFQSYNLINFKNVIDNVSLPLYYQNISRKKRTEIALQYIEKVGLAQWAKHMPNELSGGQKQRVAIARALAANPKLLLADEPTGALDSVTSQEVMRLIQAINDEGKTIVMVTHEDDIAHMCHRIVRLKDGRIVSDEKINQIRA